jgi:1-acyl-sn-glycerol-3-phosphate acyltransferase
VTDWKSEPFLRPRIGPLGWLRVARRGGLLALVVYGGLVLLLFLRLIERPVFGLRRPWTPHITQNVCRAAFVILGLPIRRVGTPMENTGAMVANHASWLDIFALNACTTLYFVAKSEVKGWAGIGWLARATGTLFIARKGTEAKTHQRLFEARLSAGHRLLFFPEGTSTDGQRVLPFKSTLFAAFFTHGLERQMHIQPVTLQYRAPVGQDPRFYGWWGDMDFAGHLLMVLAAPEQGMVEVTFHPPVPVDAFTGRKPLATYCERAIATTLPPHGRNSG